MSEVVSNGTGPEGQEREDDALAALSERVRTKRGAIDSYLAAASARRDRLMYITIFGSSLAAALMAGPAIFGKPFSDVIQTALGVQHPAWQILCAAAMIC